MTVTSMVRKDVQSRGSAQSWLKVEIIDNTGLWQDLEVDIASVIYEAVTAFVKHPKIPKQLQREVCIALSSDREVQNLNWQYRGKKVPTNVLSFPALQKSTSKTPIFMGDIIFAKETIEREAKENNVTFSAHISHLTIHGLLHLLGYDHRAEKDAQIMEELEVEILSRLGIPDPYKAI